MMPCPGWPPSPTIASGRDSETMTLTTYMRYGRSPRRFEQGHGPRLRAALPWEISSQSRPSRRSRQ